MSAGSTNIVVRIADQVEGTIAPKIRDIAAAARDANTYLVVLQTSLANLGNGTKNLGVALQQLTPNLNTAGAGTGRLTGALAQLAGRVAGAEAGFGMLGGALARVGVAAGAAGPLIVAALAVAAIAGAVIVYDKFQESARKLVLTQIDVAEQFGHNKDRLLEQKEELIGLTQGPLAKYAAELADLSQKSVAVNIASLTKELKDQESVWANLLSFAERYGSLGGGKFEPAAFTPPQATDFITAQKLNVDQSVDKEKALQAALTATGAKLVEIHNLEQKQSETTVSITEVSRKEIERFYKELADTQQESINKRLEKQKAADGEFLAQQRKASEEELRAFNEQLSSLKNASGVVSPQQTLALRQQQLGQFDSEHAGDKNITSPFNPARDTLVKDIGNAQQAIDRQDRSLQQLIEKYKLEVEASSAYSVALRTETEQRKFADEATKLAPDNANTANIIAQGQKLIAQKEQDAELDKQKIAIYNEFQGPLEKYFAAIEAIQALEQKGAIEANQGAIARNVANRALQDSINPLNEYAIGLEHEVSLLGKYGEELRIATEVDSVRQSLQKTGRDLTASETETLTKFLTELERQKQLQADVNTLYEQNDGAIQKSVIQQQALVTAYNNQIISLGQYKSATLQAVLAQEQLYNDRGLGTFTSHTIQALGEITKGYTTFNAGATKSFGDFFKSLDTGLSNAIAQFLVFNKSLSDGLLNVARNAVAQLISSLLELGIQFALVTVLEKAFNINIPKKDDSAQTQARNLALALASITAVTVAQLEAISVLQGPAWDLAEAVSLASFGANAAGAVAGITSVIAAGSIAQAHAQGGYISGPGTGLSDSIPAFLSNGEFVVNAESTRRNRSLLEALNRGASVVGSRGSSPVAAVTSLQVNVQHDGSTNVAVERIDATTVRIIARQEAQSAVQTHGPSVIAADLQNPNSRTSKAVNQNLNAPRKR